jgi:ankyrin repeat protein
MASMEEQLKEKIINNHIDEIVALLRDHPDLDVNGKDEVGLTALHFASRMNHVEVVKLLLVHPNINVNTQTISGATPVYIACAYGSISIIKLLLKDPRVNITLANSYDCTPLWCATYSGFLEVIEWLIASGRDLGDINLNGTDWDGIDYTALEIARKHNMTNVASLLGRFVANPDLVRHQVRVKFGLLDELAAEFFALIVFVCDDLLKLKPAPSFTTPVAASRFVTMAIKLPIELQMILCCRSTGSTKQNILRKDSEPAFKSLARSLLLSQDQ